MVTLKELLCFLGIWIIMGLAPLPGLNSYWSTNDSAETTNNWIKDMCIKEFYEQVFSYHNFFDV
jgi:hypothetical protein